MKMSFKKFISDPKNILILVLVALVIIVSIKMYYEYRPVVTVNGESINRAQLSRYEKDYEKGILQNLIQQKLIEQTAKQMNITVTDKEIADKLKEIEHAVEQQGGIDKFLSTAGINMSGLKNNIRINLLQDKIATKLEDNISVSDNDIQSVYDLEKEHFVNIDVKYLVVDKSKMEEIYNQLKLGKSMGDVEKEYSKYIQKSGEMKNVTKNDPIIGNEVLQSVVGDILLKNNSDSDMIIEVVDKHDTLDALKSDIIKSIRDSKKLDYFSKYMQEKLQKAKIEWGE